MTKKPEVPEEKPNTTTKEDEIIQDQGTTINNDLTMGDRTLKESVSKSNAELIPKIVQEINSLRSSKDKEDDSGEIVEYQHGKFRIWSIDDKYGETKKPQFDQIEPVQEDSNEDDSDPDHIQESQEQMSYREMVHMKDEPRKYFMILSSIEKSRRRPNRKTSVRNQREILEKS